MGRNKPLQRPLAGSPAAILNQASDTTNPNRNPSSLLLCIHGDFFLKSIVLKYYTFGASLVVPVVESPPANAGDTGSIPAPGRPHTPPGSRVWGHRSQGTQARPLPQEDPTRLRAAGSGQPSTQPAQPRARSLQRQEPLP